MGDIFLPYQFYNEHHFQGFVLKRFEKVSLYSIIYALETIDEDITIGNDNFLQVYLPTKFKELRITKTKVRQEDEKIPLENPNRIGLRDI